MPSDSAAREPMPNAAQPSTQAAPLHQHPQKNGCSADRCLICLTRPDDFEDLAGYDGLGYDDPGFRAAKRVSDALDAKRLVDSLEALELSVGKRAQRPVPAPEAFSGAGGEASSSSRRAPPSGNRRPRRRVRTDSDGL